MPSAPRMEPLRARDDGKVAASGHADAVRASRWGSPVRAVGVGVGRGCPGTRKHLSCASRYPRDGELGLEACWVVAVAVALADVTVALGDGVDPLALRGGEPRSLQAATRD
jgi:hypothetical protein